jgi:signal peptidase II
MAGLKSHIIFWFLTFAGICLDLWSKSAVFRWLQRQPDNRVSVIDGFLRLVTAENPGAAFGMASGQRYLLLAVSVIAMVIILMIFIFSRTEQRLLHVALGLFTAGVCGNLYDRIFNNGLVRDFIDVVYWPGKHWPAFNVADSMLCISVGLIIISSFFTQLSSRKHARKYI